MKKLFIVLIMFVAMNANSQWIPCDGIYGGSLQSLITLGGNTFAGTSNGVWRSTNNGTTWRQTSLYFNPVLSLATSGSISLREHIILVSISPQITGHPGRKLL